MVPGTDPAVPGWQGADDKLPGGDAQVNPLRHNKQGIINESLPGRGIKISLLFMSVNPSRALCFGGSLSFSVMKAYSNPF